MKVGAENKVKSKGRAKLNIDVQMYAWQILFYILFNILFNFNWTWKKTLAFSS